MFNKVYSFMQRKLDRCMIWVHSHTRLSKVCVVNGVSIKLETSNVREFSRATSYVTKEPETISWLDMYLGSGGVLYDVGANIGQYSLYIALKSKGKVHVYSFEPESQNYAALNRNIYLNNVSDYVTSLCLAIADRARIDSFNVHGDLRAGEAIHQFGSTVDAFGIRFNPVHKQGGMGVSLDDLHFLYGLDFPHCVKIDVDGLESAVIRGASKIINDARLQSVLIEITEVPSRKAEVDFIYDVFKNAGFRLAKKAPAQVHDPNYLSFNAIFCR